MCSRCQCRRSDAEIITRWEIWPDHPSTEHCGRLISSKRTSIGQQYSQFYHQQGDTVDCTIKIGGEAGHVIQTIGDFLGQVFARSGYYVFSHQDCESHVRGGHNFYQIRLSNRPLAASREKVDIIVALTLQNIADSFNISREQVRQVEVSLSK